MLPSAKHFDDGFDYEGQRFYCDWKKADEQEGHFLKVENPLVSELVEAAKQSNLGTAEITFHYNSYGMQLADLRDVRGKSGWLRLTKLKIDSIETVEKLVLSAYTDDGIALDQKHCERLMLIPAEQGGLVSVDSAVMQKIEGAEQTSTNLHLEEAAHLNEEYFNEEQEKLDRWAEDSKEAINQELKRLEKEIKDAKKAARAMKTLEEKTTAQRSVKKLEKEHDKKMMEFFETRKQVDEKSDELLEEIEGKLQLSHTAEEIFTIRWNLI